MEKDSTLFPPTNKGSELFEEFFESGKEESISPFLTPKSRSWGRHLSLKSSFIAAFLLLFAFLFSFFPLTKPLSNLFILFTYFFAGIPALISSLEDILNFEINIDVLMTLSAFLSILLGCEKEGALLLVLFSFSGAMEEAVSSKAKSAISALKKISPQKADVMQPDGSLIERSIKDIQPGTKIHVKAGQIVPLDGKVVEGTSFVNLVHLTGENLPQLRSCGDLVCAGARNLDGAFTLEVTCISSNSTLSRIIALILAAAEAKPKLQKWFDKLLNRYAACVITLSFLLALTLPLFFQIPYIGFEGSIYRALGFLIAASPCALIIAVPIAYLSALSAAAKQGILLKGGSIFDKLAKCKMIAMDKTGTLTKGELTFLGMRTFGSEKDALRIAYALERSALHPIAKAICKEAEERHIPPALISDFCMVPGCGLQATHLGKEIFIGGEKWILPKISSEKRDFIEKEIAKIRERGEVFSILLHDDNVSLFFFKDELRPHIKDTLASLEKNWGMRLLMLTGDHHESAKKMAFEAGITDFYANLSPEEKLNIISEHDNLIMIGDGINDAPALARSTVGISMGKMGSTTAIDASDIVLLQDNIEKLEWLIKKSKAVARIVKQNLSIAIGAILFATLPALLGLIPLWVAVVLHEGGTVIVGLNALRLLKKT